MENAWSIILVLAVVAAGASHLAVGRLIPILVARQVIDTPNARSSHTIPTPRGGGIAMMAVMVAVTAVAWGIAPPVETGLFPPFGLLAAAGLLAWVSFVDDIRSLGAWTRLALHGTCVVLGLACLPPEVATWGGMVPAWAGAPVAAAAWIWMINLTNFMDGIDGITGVNTVILGLGSAAVGFGAGVDPAWGAIGPVLAGAALGFLRWNWHPARVFLGDAGSVPLGYLLGGVLLILVAEGQPAAALILVAAPGADASITLARRLARGCSPFQAHREHQYQKALQGGWPPPRICLAYGLADLALGLLALGSLAGPGAALAALGGAGLVVLGLLVILGRAGAAAVPPKP